MNCGECRIVLSGFLDGALPADLAASVSEHLATCEGCREQLAGLERVDHAVAALAAPVPPRGYLDELQTRVRERVMAPEGEAAGERDDPADGRTRPSRVSFWRLAPLAAAALVAVVVLKIADLQKPAVQGGRRDELSYHAGEEGAGNNRAALPLEEKPAAGDKKLGTEGDLGEVNLEADGSLAERGASLPDEPSPMAKDESVSMAEKEPAPVLEPESAPMAKSAEPATWGQVKPDAEGLDVDPRREGTRDRALAARSAAPLALRLKSSKSSALQDAERLVETGQYGAARALVDSLVASAPPDTVVAQARWVGLIAHEAEVGVDPDPEVIRALAAGYAQLAAELPETEAGRNAAARAARLTLGLFAATGTAADCRAAQAQVAAFSDRYPEDVRADSLATAGASLPCSR